MEINFHKREHQEQRRPTVFMTVAVLMIIGAGLVLQCIGAWQDSQTTDEAVHLTAGYSYWRTNDHRLNPEHPPLMKLLAAVPLLAIPQLNFSTASQDWRQPNEWEMGADFLYTSRQNLQFARLLMFLGRLPMILVWTGLASLIFLWAQQRWGRLAGLVATTFFVFDPNFLGHGHLVTTDVGLTLGFAATIWAADSFFRRPHWSQLGWLCLIFALTQVTKYSALILWLTVPALGLIQSTLRSKDFSWSWWRRMVAGLVVVTAVTTWAVYGFEVKRIDSDPRIGQLWQERQAIIDQGTLSVQPPVVQSLVSLSDPAQPFGRWLQQVGTWHIPAYSYWRGLFSITSHDVWGHPAYLLGKTSTFGWWDYFPVAVAVKTPLVTFVLLLVGLSGGLRSLGRTMWNRGFSQVDPSCWTIILPPVIFFAWSMTSHINIGVRHIFPIYPFIFLLIGRLAHRWTRAATSIRLTTITIATVGIMATALWWWPNTIGYFSEAIGGYTQGHRYLLDSNLDWNQDIWRLRQWLDRSRPGPVHIVLFGSIPLDRVFPEALPVLTDQEIAQGSQPRGLTIISLGQLYNADGPFHWLQRYQPQSRIGSSILVFNFH